MKKIGGPLRDLLDRLRLNEPMAGWQATELWPEVVGERIASRSRAIAFRDGVLIVEVESPTWMSELTYHKRRIIKTLNAKLGGKAVVREIRMQPAAAKKEDR
jgi:predicted nucleic acid-binding Zn ribbon protein